MREYALSGILCLIGILSLTSACSKDQNSSGVTSASPVYLTGRGVAKYHLYGGVNKCTTAFGLDPASFGMMVTAASTRIYDKFPGMLKVGVRGGPYDPKARCVEVNPVGQTKTISVRIIDKCCGEDLANPATHQLDLSEQAFQQLAPLAQGNVNIEWKLVDCPESLQVKNDNFVCNDDYYYNK